MDESEKKENKNNTNNSNLMTVEAYTNCLMRIIELIKFNLDFNLQKNDIYLNGLLRCLNKNLF